MISSCGSWATISAIIEDEAYLRMRRRTTPAKPTRPVPSRDKVPGSGTAAGTGGPVVANPVLGPQLVPEAVQK
jgi:hypothetical protein